MSLAINPTSHATPAHAVASPPAPRETSTAPSAPAPAREGTGRIIDVHA